MLIDAPQRVEVGGLEVPNGEGHGAIVAANGAWGIRLTSLWEVLSKAARGAAPAMPGSGGASNCLAPLWPRSSGQAFAWLRMTTFILLLAFNYGLSLNCGLSLIAAYLSEQAEDHRSRVWVVTQFELHDYPGFPQVIQKGGYLEG
jgi:hypothetical protein